MHAHASGSEPPHRVEAARAPVIEAAVHRFVSAFERARAEGEQELADRLLLEAWAAYDA